MIVAKVLIDNLCDTESISRGLSELESEMNAEVVSVIRLSSAEGSSISDLLVILRVNKESERPA